MCCHVIYRTPCHNLSFCFAESSLWPKTEHRYFSLLSDTVSCYSDTSSDQVSFIIRTQEPRWWSLDAAGDWSVWIGTALTTFSPRSVSVPFTGLIFHVLTFRRTSPMARRPTGPSLRSPARSRTCPRPCGSSSTSAPSISMTTPYYASPPPSHSSTTSRGSTSQTTSSGPCPLRSGTSAISRSWCWTTTTSGLFPTSSGSCFNWQT